MLEQKLASGELRNPASGMCLDTLGKNGLKAPVGIYNCHGQGGAQSFIYTHIHEIRIADDFDRCLDVSDGVSISRFDCHLMGGNQRFQWDKNTGEILHGGAKRQKCLTVGSDHKKIGVGTCTPGNKLQEWRWGHVVSSGGDSHGGETR